MKRPKYVLIRQRGEILLVSEMKPALSEEEEEEEEEAWRELRIRASAGNFL